MTSVVVVALGHGCGGSHPLTSAMPDGGDGGDGGDGRMSGDAPAADAPDAQGGSDGATPDTGRPDAGGSGIGATCATIGGGNQLSQGTCTMDQLCITPAFGAPGGYCTALCDSAICPADALCVKDNQGSSFCFLKCGARTDCRNGYDCQSDGRGGRICLPAGNGGEPDPPIGAKPDGTACTTPEVKAPGTAERTFGANVGPISQHLGGFLEAEDFIAIFHDDVVVAYNDLATYKIGVSNSTDNGGAFMTRGNAPATTTYQSDPVVVVDAAGTFYLSWVGFETNAAGNMVDNMRVFVAKSTDHGATFTAAVPASDPADFVSGRSFLDKPWISLSPTDGTVFVSYMTANLVDGSTTLKMTRSHDKAASFETPSITLNSGGMPNARNLAQHVVDAAGNVHAVWFEGVNDMEVFGSPNNAIHYARLPAGASAPIPDITVARPADSVVYDDPTIAVDGSHVYVGYVGGMPSGAWDVKVAASADGGGTFGAGVTVNDDGPACATHFHQQIVVDGDGHLHAVWFDNRYKTGNVMYARSVDNGATWTPNQFVNDQGFEFATARDQDNWLGDYLGLAVSGKTIYCAWTDSRLQNTSHIFFAKGNLP